jgi:NIMA (never in mitosis gene a)-related kinase
MEYNILEEVGRGSYGSVYKAKHKTSGKLYAIKRIGVTRCSHYEKNCILNEMRVLSTHRCTFIVAFKSAYFLDNAVHIVTEFAINGDLHKLFQTSKQAGKRLDENQIWNFFLQLCVAVDYLHKIKVIHRDLKPANVFLDGNSNIKLGDVGVAKIMRSYMMYGQTQVGTPLYMSPEVLKRERYDTRTDVWSLGCILYEMMSLTPAFVCQNMYQLRNHVLSGKVCLTSCGNYTNALASLIPKMICVNYRHRADMKTLMKLVVIKEELAKRNLHDIINNAVEPQINVHIQMPRCHSDWTHVVKEFNSPSNTIRLSESNIMRMKNVTEKKSAFPTLFTSLRIRPKRPISEEIKRFEDLLIEAKNHVENIEAKLIELRIKELAQRK